MSHRGWDGCATAPAGFGNSTSPLLAAITALPLSAARTRRERNSFTRDDGTPLNYTLVNIRDWCKNTIEVINQLRINTDNSLQRYDVLLLMCPKGTPHTSPGQRPG